MSGVMMNELESAIVEWVSRDNAGRAESHIEQIFLAKGYPLTDIAEAFDRLLESGTLFIEDSRIKFKWPEETTMSKDGFETQLLDHVSDENKKLLDLRKLVVPTYIQESLREEAQQKTPAYNPAVHSPSHYTRGGIETIDFIEAKGLNFHLGNVVKYVSRAGFKQDAKIQDLEKALWYLTREIKRVKTQE